jgi:hypothetical protein
MIDLTKITTPFGLLDDETQAAMQAHGGPYEVFCGDGWAEDPYPSWFGGHTYRVKPTPLIGAASFYTVDDPKFYSMTPYTYSNLYADGSCGKPLTVTFPTADGKHIPGVYTSAEGNSITIEVME